MSHMKVRLRGKVLLEILARRNLSQNALARRAGLTSGHISQLLRGARNVSPRTRKRLLHALDGVPFDQLFSIRFRKGRDPRLAGENPFGMQSSNATAPAAKDDGACHIEDDGR